MDHELGRSERVYESSGDRRNYKYEAETFRINTSLVLGGDLELLSRFSVAFVLRPVRFTYSRTEYERGEVYDAVIESDSYTARDEEDSDGWTIAKRLNPTVYLTLGID